MTTVSARPSERDPSVPAPAPSTWAALRPLLLRLHFYAGVLVGPFVLVAAVTGLLYTAAPQIEQIAYRDLTHVPVGTGPVASLSDQVAAARAAHPSGAVLEIDPPEGADRATRVVFSDAGVPADYTMSVFVDPYDAQVVGQVRSFGQWLGFRGWLDDLHRNLHLGAVGRNYSELAASWLWVVVLGGLALWFGKRRGRARSERARRSQQHVPARSEQSWARRHLLPDLGARGRRRNLSWHAVLGAWLALGLLGLSVTGLTWSRWAGTSIGEVRSAFDWQSPTPSATIPGAKPPAEDDGHAAHHGGSAATAGDEVLTDGVGVDGVYRTARAQGLGSPLVLTPPARTGGAWTAAENERSWPTQYDTLTVDPADGGLVDRVDFEDWPFMAKLTDWVIGAHMGILFGLVNQLALALLAVGLIVVVLRGYRMWWQRRPTRARGMWFGPLPRRGAWRRVPKGPLAAIVFVAVVVGVLVPLLGISLLAFLLVDVVLGLVRRRPSRPRLDDAEELVEA
ncbi:peptidase [Marmoricola endophyticus]|uniref:Peptidase n=1 Tax=Marmoricola endophyticus TaxID=2040280 RepID=A0A917F4U4_9ACTN|nr:PepSY domain-containing protein [Marmoricola endophyticus]GGF50467.1 peptidase [Marmoricola endophyticus]